MELNARLDRAMRQPINGTWRASDVHSLPRLDPVILCVDDEPDMLTILRLCLSARGLEVITASNGEEALERAEEDRPDLIITDYAMPGMNGLELCRALRRRHDTRNVPIVVYSGREVWADDAALFDRFVMKPADLECLVRVIRSLLATPRAQDLV